MVYIKCSNPDCKTVIQALVDPTCGSCGICPVCGTTTKVVPKMIVVGEPQFNKIREV